MTTAGTHSCTWRSGSPRWASAWSRLRIHAGPNGDQLLGLWLLVPTERGLDFSKNRAEGDDILGNAYEYLMRHFATESGKSKGQFYTPAEVSRIMAQIVRIRI